MTTLTDYSKLRSNPSLFVEEIVGLEPFDYQAEFLDDDADRKSFRSGRQVGKSLTASWDGLHYAITNADSMVLITAPSLRQSSMLFKTLRSQMSKAGIDDETWGVERDTQTIVEFDNGSEIHCLPTGRNGNKIRGFSADLIIVDEAAFIEDTIFQDVLEPMTLATGGDIHIFSTPWGTSGYFHDAFNGENSDEWFQQHVPTIASPLVDEEDVERMKKGKTEAQIKQEILGEFVPDADSFFPTQLIRNTMTSVDRDRSHEVYVGADIAAAGADETVFVLVDGTGNVFDIKTYPETGVLEAADLLSELHNHYEFQKIVVDRTGLGQGTVESLRERAGMDRLVEDVYLTAQKKQTVYQTLKSRMQAKEVRIENNEKLRTQLDRMQANRTKSGNLSIHARKGHDDMVDALALAVWGLPDTIASGGMGARGATTATSVQMKPSSRSRDPRGTSRLDRSPSRSRTSVSTGQRRRRR